MSGSGAGLLPRAARVFFFGAGESLQADVQSTKRPWQAVLLPGVRSGFFLDSIE